VVHGTEDALQQPQILLAQTVHFQLSGHAGLPGHPLSGAGDIQGLIEAAQ